MRHAALLTAAAVVLAACSEPAAPVAPSAALPAALPASAPGADTDAFRDVTASSGVDFQHVIADGVMDTLPESVGAGVTALDYDGDGLLDLYFVGQAWHAGVSDGEATPSTGRSRLYRNLGGGRFEDVSDRAGITFEDYGYMAVAADFDDDGHTDLFLCNEGPNRLLRNRGDGTFEDVTSHAGVGRNESTVAAAAFDANGDGLLDLYVGNYVAFDKSYRLYYKPDVFPGPLAFEAQADVLFLNRGDGTFSDGTGAAGFAVEPSRAMGVTILDYDVDGKPDVYVANDATANFLFHNDGGGKFHDVAVALGVAYGVQGDATAAMAAATGDVNEDGRPDMHVTDAAYGSLYMSLPKGGFADRILASGIAGPSGQWPSWGGGFLDFDLDGHLDIYIANGDLHRATGRHDLLFRGRGDATFEDVSVASGAWFRAERTARGACIADLDGDARLDVVIAHIADRAVVLRNQTRTGHGVLIALKAKPHSASGQGARVTVRAGGKDHVQWAWPRCGYIGQGDPRLHFGLGDAAQIEHLEVVWPDGTKTESGGLAADRVWVAQQGGSVQ